MFLGWGEKCFLSFLGKLIIKKNNRDKIELKMSKQ